MKKSQFIVIIFFAGLCLYIEPVFAASLKTKIQSFTKDLIAIGTVAGIGSCVLSGLALQSQYRGALIWFRSSVIGTLIVVLAPVIINAVARGVR